MKIQARVIFIVPLLAMAILMLAGHAGSGRSEAGEQAANERPPAREIITHDAAFSAIVAAVALSDGERTREGIKKMYAALDKTLEGVRSGSVALSKGSSRVADYTEMDRKYRQRLEALDRAARHGNQREMQRIMNRLMSGCVSCHRAFKK